MSFEEGDGQECALLPPPGGECRTRRLSAIGESEACLAPDAEMPLSPLNPMFHIRQWIFFDFMSIARGDNPAPNRDTQTTLKEHFSQIALISALLISVWGQVYFTMERKEGSITNRIQAVSGILTLQFLFGSVLSSIVFVLLISDLRSLDELAYILKTRNKLLKFPIILLVCALAFCTMNAAAFTADLFSLPELYVVVPTCAAIGLFAYSFLAQFVHTFHVARFRVGVEHWRMGDAISKED
jgi:hypothetical protein